MRDGESLYHEAIKLWKQTGNSSAVEPILREAIMCGSSSAMRELITGIERSRYKSIDERVEPCVFEILAYCVMQPNRMQVLRLTKLIKEHVYCEI